MSKIKETKKVKRIVPKEMTKTAVDASKTSTNYAARLLPLFLGVGIAFVAVTTATYLLFIGTALCFGLAFLMHKTTPLKETKTWIEKYTETVEDTVIDWSATSTNALAELLLWLLAVVTIFVGYYFHIWQLTVLGCAVCIGKFLMDYFPRAWRAVQIIFVLLGLAAGLVFFLMNQ